MGAKEERLLGVFNWHAWLIPFAYAIVKLGVPPKPSELSGPSVPGAGLREPR